MISGPSAKFSPIVKQTISKNKITEPEFAAAISFSAPEEFDSSNHESGYSMLSKTFTKSKKDGKDDDSKYILDKRVLYHSLNNPLFKSKSLNFEDENESPRLVGDIYKISSPFESKWILSPKLTKLIDDNRNNLMDEFLKIFDSLKAKSLKERQSIMDSTPDSLFPAPSNLDLERYGNNLGGDTVDNLENLGKDQFNENIRDSANIFNDFKDESIFKELEEKPHLNEVSSVPNNSSYVGYNVQEVKTPQGVHGVMKIFDKNGLAQKIHYNEKGVLNQPTTSPTFPQIKSPIDKKKPIGDPNLHNVAKTAVNQLKPNTVSKLVPQQKNNTAIKTSKNIVTKKPLAPEVKQISVKIEGHNFSKNSSLDNPINNLKHPENILSDFLDQLNGVSDISNNANVRTDVHNTFHETISEKSYSYI